MTTMNELVVDHLTDSQRMINYATDPTLAVGSCPHCNVDITRWRMTVASLTATVAYLGTAVTLLDVASHLGRADALAEELTELIALGEPLAEWVAEQLNNRNIQVV